MDRWVAVFDLDGTLVETGPDLVETCNTILAAAGHPTLTPERLHPFIGLGARHMIEGALSANGLTLPPQEVEALLAAYLAHYASRIAKLSRPFPELLAALDALEAHGVRLAVCTNKREDLARQLLDALSLSERFAAIAGGDTFGVAKPDPLPLQRTVEAAGGELTRTVFVGDSRIDWLTARNAGVPFVGLTYGYSDTPMADLAPDRLMERGDDVGAAILSLMAQPAKASAAPG